MDAEEKIFQTLTQLEKDITALREFCAGSEDRIIAEIKNAVQAVIKAINTEERAVAAETKVAPPEEKTVAEAEKAAKDADTAQMLKIAADKAKLVADKVAEEAKIAAAIRASRATRVSVASHRKMLSDEEKDRIIAVYTETMRVLNERLVLAEGKRKGLKYFLKKAPFDKEVEDIFEEIRKVRTKYDSDLAITFRPPQV